jgi:hypothetical protein
MRETQVAFVMQMRTQSSTLVLTEEFSWIIPIQEHLEHSNIWNSRAKPVALFRTRTIHLLPTLKCNRSNQRIKLESIWQKYYTLITNHFFNNN